MYSGGAPYNPAWQLGIRWITLQLASREREAYGDPLAHKEVIVRRGGARCRVRVAFFSRSRCRQASERTHFMPVVARCRVLQTTVFTRQTKVLGCCCCCCCCGLGPQWALDGPKLGPLMGPSLGPQRAHDGPIWGLVGHMGPYGLTWAALAHMSPFGPIYAHDP